jgi:lipopolysaccharide export system permease protein
MIFTRYIMREVSTRFALAATVLILIYLGYTAALFSSVIPIAFLSANLLVALVFLNLVKALDVILTTALYMGVFLAFTRMHRDSEIISIMAAGISERRMMLAVLYLALMIAAVTASLSMAVKPWAYRMEYLLQTSMASDLQAKNLQSKRFVELERLDHILFAGGVDMANRELTQVELYSSSDSDEAVSQVIQAATLHLSENESIARRPVQFRNGRVYWLDQRGDSDRTLEFEALTLHLARDTEQKVYRRRAASTFDLAKSKHAKPIAEFQWRLSLPFSTLALALLAVPLSRRQQRYSGRAAVSYSVVVYAVFLNMLVVARNLVEQGVVAQFPGIWWAYVPPLALLAILVALPAGHRQWSHE